MLSVLCGNRSTAAILLFLFVNRKGYGTQMHRMLSIPLTPVQKALEKLEGEGIISSYYEGKTRLYTFNSSYPLLDELEKLLRKGYTLLPADEKKRFFSIRERAIISSDSQEVQMATLLKFWDQLHTIHTITFSAKSNSGAPTGWNGEGRGAVSITKESANVLIFSETGQWEGEKRPKSRDRRNEPHEKGQRGVNFSNVFRWTLDRISGVISLEHLRRGPDHPVFLFHLATTAPNTLSSVDSHLCGGDNYFGTVTLGKHGLTLNWRVIGPQKNELISYKYY